MKYAWILLMCLIPSAWGQEGANATVRGELLLADGSPAVGASVVLSLEILRSAENGGTPARTMPNHASALVGADGSFLLSCSAESVGIYELEASLGAQDIKSWTWIGMEAGEEKDLGSRTFAARCFVEGHLEAGDGEVLVTGWKVLGVHEQLTQFSGPPPSHSADVDKATGRFRLGPFRQGNVTVSAKLPGQAQCESQVVSMSPSADAYVVLRLEGSHPTDRMRFTARCDFFPSFRLDRTPGVQGAGPGLVLVDADGNAQATAVRSSSGTYDWEIETSGVGEHVVEVRHPAFAPLRLEGLLGGPTYEVDLKGSAALKLEVINQRGGPLRSYGASVSYPGVRGSSTHRYSGSRDPAPAGGLLEGLIPGDLRLAVEAPWGETLLKTITGLAPGETREVRLEFMAPRTIDIAVEEPGGAPAAGVAVVFGRGGAEGLYEPFSRRQDPKRRTAQVAWTDPEGRVGIDDGLAGQWTVRAFASAFAYTELSFEHGPGPNQVRTLRLPEVGSIEGHLTAETPFDFTVLSVYPAVGEAGEEESRDRLARRLGLELPAVGADGRFRVDGVPVGKVELLILPDASGRELSLRKRALFSLELDVHPGTQSFQAPLTGPLDVTLKVALRSSQGNADGLRVAALEEPAPGQDLPAVRYLELDAGMLTSGGEVRLEGLRPVVGHRVFVTDDRARWIGFGYRIGALAPGKVWSISKPLELVTHRVEVVSPKGGFLPDTEVAWACRGWSTFRCRGVTDEFGRIELTMPAGSYGLFRPDEDEPRLSSFLWSASESPETILLPDSQ